MDMKSSQKVVRQIFYSEIFREMKKVPSAILHTKKEALSDLLLLKPYTTLNIFWLTSLILPSFFISSLGLVSSSILIISSLASSNPRCVYTFIVMLMSECPIRYCSVLGLIPALAILVQYACLHM